VVVRSERPGMGIEKSISGMSWRGHEFGDVRHVAGPIGVNVIVARAWVWF
jgi:hypothetical protein